MKKLLLLAVVIAAASFTHAQVSVGIHGNVIGASMKNSEDGQDFDFDTRISWKGGLVAWVPLTTNLNFMPQLNVLSKGGKIEESESSDLGGATITETIKANAKLNYIELPLNFVYSTGAEEGGFFIGIGPSIGFGFGGKIDGDYTFTAPGVSESEPFDFDVKFDGKTDDELDADDEAAHYKRFDFGANVIAGYRLSNGVFINAHYNYSFSNINPNAGIESKNRYFGIGIGYFFGRQ
jgi:hypothetical protein